MTLITEKRGGGGFGSQNSMGASGSSGGAPARVLFREVFRDLRQIMGRDVYDDAVRQRRAAEERLEAIRKSNAEIERKLLEERGRVYGEVEESLKKMGEVGKAHGKLSGGLDALEGFLKDNADKMEEMKMRTQETGVEGRRESGGVGYHIGSRKGGMGNIKTVRNRNKARKKKEPGPS